MSSEEEMEVKKPKFTTTERSEVGDVQSVQSEEKKDLMELPRKKFYRQRAHANPLSDRDMFHPASPELMNWNEFFGEKYQNCAEKVLNADIGCGYGGLLFKLSEIFPEECSVSKYVQDKVTALRHNELGKWQNICCIRTNAMRFLSHFFAKGQLNRMFFLYPDPHFKKSKHKWRIISVPLISEYAYLIKTGGLLYTVTDVLQYHEWVLENFACSKLFEKVSEEELVQDPVFKFVFDTSEEGKKVTRNEGDKYYAIYRRTQLEPHFQPNLDGTSCEGAEIPEVDSDCKNEEEVLEKPLSQL